MRQINQQEFEIGFWASFPIFFFGEWWAVLLAPACALLWALGGTYNKAIRRFGVPLLLFGGVTLFNGYHASHWLAVGMGIAILHIGDGFPDHRPQTASKGSILGRIVEKIVKPRDQAAIDRAGILTKWLIPVIFQISLIPYWIAR